MPFSSAICEEAEDFIVDCARGMVVVGHVNAVEVVLEEIVGHVAMVNITNEDATDYCLVV